MKNLSSNNQSMRLQHVKLLVQGFQFHLLAGFPVVQVKDTLWEGGVRGAALVWSPLLKSSPRVSNQMMNIQDWLPTLYSAAGMAAHPLLCCRYGCPPFTLLQVWLPSAVPTLYHAGGMTDKCPPFTIIKYWLPTFHSAAGVKCIPCTLLQVLNASLYSSAGVEHTLYISEGVECIPLLFCR